MSIYANRRKRLLSLSEDKAVVITKPENLFYTCDFFGGAVGIVKPDRTLLVTTPLEKERAEALGREVEVKMAATYSGIWDVVRGDLNSRRALVDDDAEARKLRGFERRDALFLEARKVKDHEEVGRIRKASRILDSIYEMLEKEVRVGRTEREIAAEVLRTAILEGATPSGFQGSLSPTIFASGPNGALPHADLTDRKVRAGDFIIADLTFRYEGYNSDATRTFAAKAATAEMRERYEAVAEAQMRGLELSRTGSVCGEVHGEVTEVLRKHGLEKFFVHSTGHGVGIDVHELPNLRKGNEKRLEKNDVITIEPGVYFPGKYGIRVEDTVLVSDRPVVLNHYTKELVTVG